MKLFETFFDVIESFFIESELVDINLTDQEVCERASFDSLAVSAANDYDDKEIPIGKRVL